MAKTPRIVNKGVAIDDLDDFRRDLQRLVREGGPDGLSLLKDANSRVAKYVIARAKTRGAGISRMHARAASTMVASQAATKATITGGNSQYPFFGAAEFGVKPSEIYKKTGKRKELGGRNGPNYATGRIYRKNGRVVQSLGWMQFAKYPWEEPGHGRTGYFLFPTLRAQSENIKEMYVRELDDICKIAFPNGRF